MRIPDEIKRALRCNRKVMSCAKCVYNINDLACSRLIMTDALEYIEDLEGDNAFCEESLSGSEQKSVELEKKCSVIVAENGKLKMKIYKLKNTIKKLTNMVSAENLRRGQWKIVADGFIKIIRCSSCKEEIVVEDGEWNKMKHCPYCGARMSVSFSK